MRHTINSRVFGTSTFFMPDSGGYVRLESTGKSGTLAPQICDGGGFMGSTVSASPASFAAECKKWHAARLRNRSKY